MKLLDKQSFYSCIDFFPIDIESWDVVKSLFFYKYE